MVVLCAGCQLEDDGSEGWVVDATELELGETHPAAVPDGLDVAPTHQGETQAACHPGPPFGGVDWEMDEPEEHGLSSEGLDDLATLAEGLNSSCLLVLHDGVLVGEWYWNGYDADTSIPDVFSITKSITSALVGIADYQGVLDVDDRVSDYVPEWQNTASEDVTIRQLLVQDSGRTFDINLEWGLPQVEDQTAYALAAGQAAPPGSQWVYTNLGYQAIEAVLDAALDVDVAQFAEQELFAPLGMTSQMARDPADNTLLYSGVSASCRDLALFGRLYQRRGRWLGQRLMKRRWVRRSLKTSTEFNDAYGIGWWLNNEGHVVLPQVQQPFEYEGRFIPSGDEDIVTALGAFGNFMSVESDDGYVIVRLADVWEPEDILGLGKIDELWAAFEDAKI